MPDVSIKLVKADDEVTIYAVTHYCCKCSNKETITHTYFKPLNKIYLGKEQCIIYNSIFLLTYYESHQRKWNDTNRGWKHENGCTTYNRHVKLICPKCLKLDDKIIKTFNKIWSY